MSGLANTVDITGSVASGFAMGQAAQRTELERLHQAAAQEEAALERELRQKQMQEGQRRYDTARQDDLTEKQTLGALLDANQPSLGLHVPGGADQRGDSPLLPIYGNPEAESSIGGFGGEPAMSPSAQGAGAGGPGGFSWANLDPVSQRHLLSDAAHQMRQTETENRQRDAYRKQRDQLFANLSRMPGGTALVERLKDPVQRHEALASSSFASNANRWLPIIEGGEAADNEMSMGAINSAMERAAKQQEAAAALAQFDQAVASMNGVADGVPAPMTPAQQYARNAVLQGAKLTDPVVRAAVDVKTIGEQNSARRETQLNEDRKRKNELADKKLSQLAGKTTEAEKLQIDLIKERMNNARTNFDSEAFDAALGEYDAIVDAVNARAGTRRVEAPAPVGRTPAAGAAAAPAAGAKAGGGSIWPFNPFNQGGTAPSRPATPSGPGAVPPPAAAPAPTGPTHPPEVQSAASFVSEFKRQNGRPPTREEFDAALGGRGQ